MRKDHSKATPLDKLGSGTLFIPKVVLSDSSTVSPQIGGSHGLSTSPSLPTTNPLIAEVPSQPGSRRSRKAKRRALLATPKITSWLLKCPGPTPSKIDLPGDGPDDTEPSKQPLKQKKRRRKSSKKIKQLSFTFPQDSTVQDHSPLPIPPLCSSPVLAKENHQESRTPSMSPRLRQRSGSSMGPSVAVSKPNDSANGCRQKNVEF